MKSLCPLFQHMENKTQYGHFPMYSCEIYKVRSLIFPTYSGTLNKNINHQQKVLQSSIDLNLREPQQYHTWGLSSNFSTPICMH